MLRRLPIRLPHGPATRLSTIECRTSPYALASTGSAGVDAAGLQKTEKKQWRPGAAEPSESAAESPRSDSSPHAWADFDSLGSLGPGPTRGNTTVPYVVTAIQVHRSSRPGTLRRRQLQKALARLDIQNTRST